MDAPDTRSPERVGMDTKPGSLWHEILGRWFHIRGKAAISAALVGRRMDTTEMKSLVRVGRMIDGWKDFGEKSGPIKKTARTTKTLDKKNQSLTSS